MPKPSAPVVPASPVKKAATTPTTAAAPVAPLPALVVDPEVLKRRQERFGVVNPALPALLAEAEAEKRKQQRAERFTLAEGPSPTAASPAAASPVPARASSPLPLSQPLSPSSKKAKVM